MVDFNRHLTTDDALIIAGSRTLGRHEVDEAMRIWGRRPRKIIQGGARGVDTAAREWAYDHDVSCTAVPAEWETYGTSAGFIRNAEMIKMASHLVAVWDGKSVGTAHTIMLAKKIGLGGIIYKCSNMQVININSTIFQGTTPVRYAYIGRAGKGVPGPLGNPFYQHSRESNIEAYRRWARQDMKTMALIASLPEDANLGCFCKPKECHGDVIIDLWREMHVEVF